MTRKPTTGSIYRPKYKYKGQLVESQVRWIAYYVQGRLVRESAKTESWDEANLLLKRRPGEIVSGKFAGVGAERIRVEQLLSLVEQDYLENNRKTLLDVQIRNRRHLIPALGGLRAAELSAGRLKQYVRERQKEGAANATINRELAIVGRAFRLGQSEDPPLVGPMPHIPKLREDNVREGSLPLERYKVLLVELPKRLKLPLVIGYHTGVRSGELKKIRIDQVDLKAKVIYVSRRTTKNQDAHTLPIYGDMAAWIEMAISERDTKFPNCPWLFFNDEGKRLGTFRKAWASACERAGMPGLLFHDLRRSAAMNMDRAGIPRRVIMQITGHKTEAMFLRYRIVNEQDLAIARQKMETYLSLAPPVDSKVPQRPRLPEKAN